MSTKHKLEPPEFSFQYIINSEMLANRTVEKAGPHRSDLFIPITDDRIY